MAAESHLLFDSEDTHFVLSVRKHEDKAKDGKEKTIYIYNVCDHQECYKEVGSQAVSYTTGVPAMIGAMMMVTGKWNGKGVFNVEEFDPDPYMEALISGASVGSGRKSPDRRVKTAGR